MPSAIIVGSGSSAAAAALALADQPGWRVTVVDIGATLEQPQASARNRLSRLPSSAWPADDVRRISVAAVGAQTPGLPEKRSYGSAYPFDDHGQLEGVHATGATHPQLISGAYGGFSTVWGAQFTPFPSAALAEWPLPGNALDAHYRGVAAHVPVAGVVDDLAAVLPLYGLPLVPPPLSARAEAVLAGYEAHRERLRRRGFILGRSRVAMHADACVLCGLCNTGCPYSLIYSASQTFDELRAAGRVEYRPGLLVTRLLESAAAAAVEARNLRTGAVERLDADRVFVACGAVGTTRLVMASLDRHDEYVTLRESAQFVVPFASARSTGDPRAQHDFTLGQLSALLGDGNAADIAHLQLYTYDPAFVAALPAPLRRGSVVTAAALGRLCVGLGYLSSSSSPTISLRLGAERTDGLLPTLEMSADRSAQTTAALQGVLRILLRAAPSLDLWPVLPRVEMSAPGKSYHWGGSLPHRAGTPAWPASDLLGRVAPWRRIHVVDSAVMPTIAATSFTYTMMANAHRIAATAVRLPGGG